MNLSNNNKSTIFLIPSFLSADNEASLLAPVISEVIQKTDYYLVENVRTARRFISKLQTGRVIEELQFFVLDKKTKTQEVEKILKEIPGGKDIGILSEAGCPGVADPGAVAISVAHKKGLRVVALPGPSAILLALMGSGFSGQQFRFVGYLPIDRKERIKRIKELEKEMESGETQIFMETPYRNNQVMKDLVNELRAHTSICVACEVTGANELLATKTASEWQKNLPELHKRPTVFVLGKNPNL